MRRVEESGQGYSYADIIDRPELKSGLRLSIERLTTITFWCAYIYCLLPVFNAMLLSSGINLLRDGIMGLRPVVPSGLLLLLGTAALVTVSPFVLWVLFNYFTRRTKGVQPAVPKKVAAITSFHGLNVRLARAKTHQRIVIDATKGEIICSTQNIVAAGAALPLREYIEDPFLMKKAG